MSNSVIRLVQNKIRSSLTKLSHSALTFACVLGASGYSSADDTEIFFGSPGRNTVTPNVLFILDNSGSMATQETTVTSYDPSITYSGWIVDDYIYVYSQVGANYYYQGVISKANTRCQTMLDKLNAAGLYVGDARVASYGTSGWQNILVNNTNIATYGPYDDLVTECKHDSGVHGETAGSSKVYANRNSSGGAWVGQVSKELGWDAINQYEFRSANYMNWYFFNRVTASKSRLEIMKEVVTSLVDSTSGINIGLAAFNTDNSGTQGGSILVPMGYIDDVKSEFKTEVNNLGADTWTPLAETLHEAVKYYQGESIYLGSQTDSDAKDPSDSSKYLSPIEKECQPNNIVVLTDGEPTYDAHASGYYNSDDTATRNTIQSTIGKSCSGNCLDEIAKYAHDNDMSGLPDEQTITTYTIGFNIDHDLLKRTAEGDPSDPDDVGGGGKYFTTSTAEQLSSAFKFIFDDINSTSTTFVTPGVAVNSFNRLNHRDELYFSVFRPEQTPFWGGNLKRYRIGSDGTIYDAKGNKAIDENTGYFRSTTRAGGGAHSWWSANPDGDLVEVGGAAENLPDNNNDRNVFTYITGNSKVLSDSTNEISVANKSVITDTVLGISGASTADHESLINWIRGIDTEDEDEDNDRTDARKLLMDPLHSPPVVVIYGGSDSNPDTTIFYGDNQGFIHAINGTEQTGQTYGANGGDEIFAFMPQELLTNQNALKENAQSTPHPYGMDGAISTWTYDSNENNVLTDSGDFVRIFSGMRRGGNSYYALDVTDRKNPELMWQITGGSGDFVELGQTWSRPAKTKVKMNGNFIDVLVFAGGYDTAQDSATVRSTDSIGNAIYIVEAETGKLIWKANSSTFSDMKYSIPSNVRTVDINGDGAFDQMYVGDMGGQVWRFDIDNENSGNTSLDVYGGVIADLAGSTTADNRRFYHAPDVSVVLDGGTRKLAIAIGSGWQAHPLDDAIEDRFYLMKLGDVQQRPIDANGDPNYVKLTETDLYDATDNHLGHVSSQNTQAQQTQAYLDLGQAQGWYIKLERAGEKVLASSLTVDGEIFFTTYEPTPNSIWCNVTAGTPRIFRVSLLTGEPVKNYYLPYSSKDTELTKEDREVQLRTTSLPTTPQRLRIDGKDVLCIGTECESLDRDEEMLKTYWLEEE